MPAKEILNDDWTEYDNRKTSYGGDIKQFDGRDQWELDYLKEKFKKHHPGFYDTPIAQAMELCYRELNKQCVRERFVACVCRRLGVNETAKSGKKPASDDPGE